MNHYTSLKFYLTDKNIHKQLFRNLAIWFQNHKKVSKMKYSLQFKNILHLKMHLHYPCLTV